MKRSVLWNEKLRIEKIKGLSINCERIKLINVHVKVNVLIFLDFDNLLQVNPLISPDIFDDTYYQNY